MPDQDTIRNRLLALIAGLLVVAGLRWSFPVTMPLAVAVFIVAAVWPIKPWLDQALPSSLSYIGTILVLVLIFAGFIAAVYLAISQVVQTFFRDQEQFRQLYEAYASWATERGLPVLGGQDGYGRLIALAQAVLARVYTVLAYLGFIAVLVILGLPEVPAFGHKVRDRLPAVDGRQVFDTVEQIAEKFRSYIGVTTLTSLITGAASAVWALAIGLDLALIWGVLNFLLNYVPMIGNIIGIFPPSLYALIQFQSWTMALVVFLGYAAIQITISNFVYPYLQGRGLALSPVAIVVALAFWGWIWGMAGVLLAVPLTAALVIICEHFRSTEWIAKLLSKG